MTTKISSDNIQPNSVTAGSLNVSGGFNFRNKLINGNFDVWQRGTSQTSSGYGSADRWENLNVGSTKTASRQEFALGQTDVPNNPKYFMRHVVTSVAGASNFVFARHKVENVETLSGKTVTLSFWAKADASKNIAISLSQYFGSGGSPSDHLTGIGSQLIALTTSWEKHTVTVDLPSVSGKTLGTNNNDFLGIYFWFDAGSDWDSRTASLGQQSGTFDIAQVQLEEGSSATPFEMRPIGMELSLCQRYYELVNFQNTASSGGFGNSYVNMVKFLPKRNTPTITYYSAQSAAGTAGSLTWYPGGTVAAASTNALFLDGIIPYRAGTNTYNFVIGSVVVDAEL